jgi:hypothetical protein
VAAVAETLKKSKIEAVLTGGACATIYSDGEYQSNDLDFILDGAVTRRQLDEAMAAIGFHRQTDHYTHADTSFFVEFPRGPLAIGRDASIRPAVLKLGRVRMPALSATDSCRDRLAAFYFWDDLSSLKAAVAIARRQRINLAAIRRWSDAEGHGDKFHLFQRAYKRARKR